MINELIGQGIKKADDAVLDDAKKDADGFKALLAGPDRTPIDIQKEKAVSQRGEELSTPDGGPTKVPSKPVKSDTSGPVPVSQVKTGKQIIAFGRVHHDITTQFPNASPVDDTADLGATADPGRAIYFRAAVEREAILLNGIADAIGGALQDKADHEGALGGLAKAAVDIVGGFGGNATAGESADLKPFITKIGTAWDTINVSDIKYGDLHAAAIKLHEVRANLTAYLHGQLDKKNPKDAPKGLLSHVPLIGDVPLPGPVGDIVGTFKKISGKLNDVNNALIFGLTIAMQPAIETACSDITLDAIKNRKPRAYPVWFGSDQIAPKDDTQQKPLADFHTDGPFKDQLTDIKALSQANKGIHDFVEDRDKNVNDAASKPMELVEFLSKPVPVAPGNTYIDTAFQVAIAPTTPPDGSPSPPAPLGGSEKLGQLAVAAFYKACANDVPGFMQGFVENIVEYVFAVCVEFLRSVFRVLCGLHVQDVISTDELTAAGSTHILTHLVDFLTSKLGLDDLIKNHMTIPIPAEPSFLPAGINWPSGKLSAAPIVAKLKDLFLEKAEPYLKPVVEYAMSDLAQRLNARRAWAGPSALTMEVHLGQLPTELALLFKNLIQPLWHFLDDTCLEIVKDVVGKGMGPAGKAVGLAGDAFGKASGLISDIQQKASNVQQYAKTIEDKVADLQNKLSNFGMHTPWSHSNNPNEATPDDIGNAIGAVKDAIKANPLAGPAGGGDGQKSGDPPPVPGAQMPKDRKNMGQGKAVDEDDLKKDLKWPDAIDGTKKAADPDGGASS